MSRLFRFSLAILLVLGVASTALAASIPTGMDPKNHPEVWTIGVYNNEGSSLTSGTVVCWDFDSVSSPAEYTDQCMYVNTTTTAANIWTAGVVVSPSIAAGESGTIAIWGPVYVRAAESSGTGFTTSQLVANCDDAEGQAEAFDSGGADCAALGVAIKAAPSTVATGGFGGTDGQDNIMILIFVDPTRFDDG